MSESAGDKFQQLVSIMARLRGPGGCPWDREQTFDSIKHFTLEETYEVLEAIDNRDWHELTGELGDLLLQVLFFAEMAQEVRRVSAEEDEPERRMRRATAWFIRRARQMRDTRAPARA